MLSDWVGILRRKIKNSWEVTFDGSAGPMNLSLAERDFTTDLPMLGDNRRITGWHPVVWQNHPVARFDHRMIYRAMRFFVTMIKVHACEGIIVRECTIIIVHACTMIIVKQMHNPVNHPVVEMSYRMILPNHRVPSCDPVFVPMHEDDHQI